MSTFSALRLRDAFFFFSYCINCQPYSFTDIRVFKTYRCHHAAVWNNIKQNFSMVFRPYFYYDGCYVLCFFFYTAWNDSLCSFWWSAHVDFSKKVNHVNHVNHVQIICYRNYHNRYLVDKCRQEIKIIFIYFLKPNWFVSRWCTHCPDHLSSFWDEFQVCVYD